MISSRSVLVGSLIALAAPAAPAEAEELHPRVVLRDADGEPVRDSGRPIDPRTSCGGDCHDVAFIETNNYHVGPAADAPSTSRWDQGPGLADRFAPLVHQEVAPRGAPGRDERWVGGSEVRPLNCFLCHTETPNLDARREVLRAGAGEWDATATLKGAIVDWVDGRWTYRAEVFDADGSVTASALGLAASSSGHCTSCHADLFIEEGRTLAIREPARLDRGWATGFVYSGASVHDSALNVEGKAEATRPFDVHAERLLECADCHHSINNPAYRAETDATRPAHLRFDARREGIADYVRRPSHHLATGAATQSFLGAQVANSMRRCEDCHAAEETHDWLPFRERHLQVMACETCHVPRVEAPILETVDWTVLTSSTSPRTVYRGTDAGPADVGTLRPAFRPIWLPRRAGSRYQMMPHNLVTYVFWVGGESAQPVSVATLRAALFDDDGELHDALRMHFDLDRSGAAEPDELVLERPGQVEAVASALEAFGVSSPRIVAEVQPFGIHHGTAGKEHATRDCSTCHGDEAAAKQERSLARALPPGAEVSWAGRVPPAGDLAKTPTGGLVFRPNVQATGLYVLGQHRNAWVDGFGMSLVALVILGAFAHGAARIFWGRGRG